MFAAVEREQAGGAIAAEVVQPHHTPVRVFREWLECEQFARVRECVGVVTRLLGHVTEFDQRLAHAALAVLALLRQPGTELGALGRHVAQHRIGIGQVVLQALGQCQRGAAAHEGTAVQLAQLEQTLAQGVARRLGLTLGPQQLRQAQTLRRPFERQPGEQGRVARGQGDARARRVDERGRLAEAKLH